MPNTGVFRASMPVEGLSFETLTHQGLTNAQGEFQYEEGEVVTFAIGKTVLGSAHAKPAMTPANLSNEAAGIEGRIGCDKVTNMARLLMSIDTAHSIEDAIVIAPEVAAMFKPRMSLLFNQSPEKFETCEPISGIMKILGTKLVTPERARNYLRRAMAGIVKKTDVKIPTRDGGYTLADIYLPAAPGKYPVVMSFAGYGKSFWAGTDYNEDDIRMHEKWEDEYFSGTRVAPSFMGELDYTFGKTRDPEDWHGEGMFEKGTIVNPCLTHISEYFERANTRDWVPRGYVCMFVDSRGLGNVPGKAHQFARPEADDYYDAIEWAGVQPWSNGKVGLYGASYYGMNAFAVASLQPPHLAAMLSFAGDSDFYRDNSHPGGMSNQFTTTVRNSAGEWDGISHEKLQDEVPFDDPEIYNDHSDYPMCFDPAKIKTPLYTDMPADTFNFIHTRGTSETFINCSTPDDAKHLDIISETGIHAWMYDPHIQQRHFKFFDYWLKGEGEGMADEPRVNVMVRTGWSGYYVQQENEWPIARTDYKRFHLHIANDDFHKPNALAPEAAESAASVSYPATAPEGIAPDVPTGPIFMTEPLEEDMVLAGYSKLKLFASSTSTDMAAQVQLRALDENGEPVAFAVEPDPAAELTAGVLKLSHRKEDPERSTDYRPYHTHLEQDAQPLVPGEVVEATVELVPATARLKKGWRLALFFSTNILGIYDPFDDYSKDATYTIYAGGDYDSYLQVPVIPEK